MKRVTPELKRHAHKLWKKYGTVAAVARRLNRHPDTVRRWMAEFPDYKARSRNPKSNPPCPKCGDPTVKVGKRNKKQCYRCQSCHWQSTLNNTRPTIEQKFKAQSMRNAGCTLTDIGSYFGRSHSTISRWIKSLRDS